MEAIKPAVLLSGVSSVPAFIFGDAIRWRCRMAIAVKLSRTAPS